MKVPNPIGGETDLETLIHMFHRMHHGCMRYELEKRGLSEIFNPGILFILRGSTPAKPITQRRIADELGVSPPTVAVSIKRMEKAGLVRKEPDPGDLRKNCITLTDKGRALTGESLCAGRNIYEKLIEGFAPDEIAALKSYYLRMIRNLSSCARRLPAGIPVPEMEDNAL